MSAFNSRKASSGLAAISMVVGLVPVLLFAQSVPPSALVNQRSQEALEAARAVSPHTTESALAYFEDELEAAVERASQRVWDPTTPREPSPRTPWGHPDLRGYWLNVNYVPFERPDDLTGKPLYTVEEALEVFARAALVDASYDPTTVHYDYKEFGMNSWQSPMVPNLRTSLIVDPPDGRFPALTSAGRAQRTQETRVADLETRSLFERCITGNQGPPRVPSIRNYGESQIVQTPDHVLILTQVNSEVRIIPLDDRPHSPDNIRPWLGDSRGYWDNDTLVVETRNFHEKRWWSRVRGAGPNLHLTERYTRVEDDLLLYEATLDDPTVWEAPWTYEIPQPKMEPPGLFEFACHEMNYGLINVMRGARTRAAEYEAEQAE
ncbi:MAG: hypothetical protein CM1200mP36_03040 [Gammaproteobacteria bacterium]|nr:MAG: hypothetical protein CM1200mP36_03040 [Gammaproteobacteria bacterium]